MGQNVRQSQGPSISAVKLDSQQFDGHNTLLSRRSFPIFGISADGSKPHQSKWFRIVFILLKLPVPKHQTVWSIFDPQLLLFLSGLVVIVVVAILVVKWVRSERAEDTASTHHSLMTNLREMHATGEISDEEYRNLKSNLASKLRSEFDAGKKKS